MPDWSYQTILRPLLFSFSAEKSRDLTLKAMGRLASAPLGPAIIQYMGDMRPPETVQRTSFGLNFPSPVGLGAGLDPEAIAPHALQEFGFGFMELGPVTVAPVAAPFEVKRWRRRQALIYPDVPVNPGLDVIAARLEKYRSLSLPVGIRLGYRPGADALDAAEERAVLIQRLAPFASFFTLDCQSELTEGRWTVAEWSEHLKIVCAAQANSQEVRPVLVCLRPDLDQRRVVELVNAALSHDLCGVVVTGGIASPPGSRLVGKPCYEPSLQLVRFLHREYGDRLTIIGSGGILEPKDALEFLDAGATLVQIHSGLVYSGPGLPKRSNEAIAYYCPPTPMPVPPPAKARSRLALSNVPSWLCLALLGVGLAVSGVAVWLVAITRTVLPYDEAFVGLSRADMIALNARLLPFMAHDRVTLSGTMISTGLLYIGLSVYGIRRGAIWARRAVLVSSISGFLGFFLFLGFGYFDSIHALLTLGLLPFFLLGIIGKQSPPTQHIAPNLTNNQRWKAANWGQLLFVVIGLGLLLGGSTIIIVGISQTFVPEDLQFMNTTAQVLSAASPHLLPLIAHDRVGFGGNLISVGLAVLLLALWGYRQGERWVWWTLAAGGLPGFVAALGIHLAVDYLNLWHLFPAITAVLVFVIALALSFRYLYYPESISRSRQPESHVAEQSVSA